jgi:biofilm protein TabA
MKIILAFAFLFLAAFTAEAQTAPSHRQVKKWYKKDEWKGGFAPKPHKTTNKEALYVQYHKNPEWWTKAFAFLQQQDLKNLAPGKYPIVGDDVYASVTNNNSRDFDSTQWEGHRKFIDIQFVIDGKELIGVFPIEGATVTKPYDEKKDVMNVSADGKLYKASPETFFIFFPSDAHRPNITPGGNKKVKKIVIKIRVA